MAAKHREQVAESSEDEAESFDNYGVFQSDYEFKFVQEGNEKTTLMLPQVTYDSMEVNYFNIEIEVDNMLHVSALEKEQTKNGTTRFSFRIAKQKLRVEEAKERELMEALCADGYDYENMVDLAANKTKKQKLSKTGTPMEAHNYSKAESTVSSATQVTFGDTTKQVNKVKQTPETTRVKVEALDGTEIDHEASVLVQLVDAEEMDEDAEEMEDDGDDDLDDFDESEFSEISVGDAGEGASYITLTPKTEKRKVEAGTSSEKKRKYTKTSHYSKESSNFTVELTEEGRLFKCGSCNYTSRYPGNMRDHVRLHTGEKPFQCKICGKNFSNQTSQKKHMVIHSDARPHSCNICGFTFKQKPQLLKHYKRHLSPGHVKCSVCNKGYYSQAELRHHMPTHTGEKKFKCDECEQSFTTKSSLGRHKLLHGGAKFECHVCGFLTSRKEYWRAHLIKAHDFDENDEILAKRTRFRRLYEHLNPQDDSDVQTINISKDSTIRIIKAETLKSEEVQGTAHQVEQTVQVEGQEGDEQVQYIISLDY